MNSERGGLKVKVCATFLHAEMAKMAVLYHQHAVFVSTLFSSGGEIDLCIVQFSLLLNFFP